MESLRSFSEVAKELGMTVEEVIKAAKDNGLIDEEGKPTQFAIDNGLLVDLGDTSLN